MLVNPVSTPMVNNKTNTITKEISPNFKSHIVPSKTLEKCFDKAMTSPDYPGRGFMHFVKGLLNDGKNRSISFAENYKIGYMGDYETTYKMYVNDKLSLAHAHAYRRNNLAEFMNSMCDSSLNNLGVDSKVRFDHDENYNRSGVNRFANLTKEETKAGIEQVNKCLEAKNYENCSVELVNDQFQTGIVKYVYSELEMLKKKIFEQ